MFLRRSFVKYNDQMIQYKIYLKLLNYNQFFVAFENKSTLRMFVLVKQVETYQSYLDIMTWLETALRRHASESVMAGKTICYQW